MMAQVKTKEQDDDHQAQPAPGPFVPEAELRQQSVTEPLGGCDVEHCQRMHE
jgi:hypothetical protein